MCPICGSLAVVSLFGGGGLLAGLAGVAHLVRRNAATSPSPAAPKQD